MLKKLFFAFCVAVAGVSCLKTGDRTCAFRQINIVAPQIEQDSIAAYLDSNSIQAQHHQNGFYYKIIDPGTGTDTMTLCSDLLIDFKGQLKDDSVFQQGTDAYLVLGAMIEGWKLGIPLIKKGGEIKLFIPPSLAFGYADYKNDQNEVLVPANSFVIYTVKLKDYSQGY
jgi:FKBP-type peptidyl-prolyl cis-trans isomerase FkpA